MLIGVAGASGSGKTFFAGKLKEVFSPKSVCILSQDFYYKKNSHIPFAEREKINYDHPDAIDFDLLEDHLILLKNGRTIEHPVYDFRTHDRLEEKEAAGPADIIILDGILIFAVEKLLDLFDYKVFVDTPMDICFIRRLQRDRQERGRTTDSVINQYLKTVRPMLLKFVLPSISNADLVIKGEGDVMEKAKIVVENINRLHE